ncbi:MAG: cytochrome oxidase putative small subunit CydP [Methylophilaceae bacterium]
MVTWYFNRIKHLKQKQKNGRLVVEVTIIIVVKIALLWLLWALCFSHPIAKDARQLAVTRMILSH